MIRIVLDDTYPNYYTEMLSRAVLVNELSIPLRIGLFAWLTSRVKVKVKVKTTTSEQEKVFIELGLTEHPVVTKKCKGRPLGSKNRPKVQ